MKNQPSVSDSAKINDDSSSNGRANGTSTDPDFMMADVIPQLTSDHSRIPQREIHIDPSADPSFLDEPE
ncbi:MAG TPA: hypothetical protein PLZ51_13035, partial [Aggregatilineales bacterium]|nr:hypothetical protein [Aggregatilineales bacterium]